MRSGWGQFMAWLQGKFLSDIYGDLGIVHEQVWKTNYHVFTNITPQQC